MVDPKIVDTYIVGKEGFIVGLCEALGVPEKNTSKPHKRRKARKQRTFGQNKTTYRYNPLYQ